MMNDKNSSLQRINSDKNKVKIPKGAIPELFNDTLGFFGHEIKAIGQEMLHQISPNAVAKPGHYISKTSDESDNSSEDTIEKKMSVVEEKPGKEEDNLDSLNKSNDKYVPYPLVGNATQGSDVDRSKEPSLDQLENTTNSHKLLNKAETLKQISSSVSQRIIDPNKHQRKRYTRSVVGQMFYLIFMFFKLIYRSVILISKNVFRVLKIIYEMLKTLMDRIFWKSFSLDNISKDTEANNVTSNEIGEKVKIPSGNLIVEEEKTTQEQASENISEEIFDKLSGIVYDSSEKNSKRI